MCKLAQEIVEWSEQHMVSVSARYILGRKDTAADQVICQDLDQSDRIVYVIQVNTKLPIYVCLVLDPMAWKQDAFSTHGTTICFTLTGLVKGSHVGKPLHDTCCSIVGTERVVSIPSGFSGEKTSLASQAVKRDS